tara:strand:- start:6233 stop:7999 length:1767 start_codon:yes stop_codon:yes gene_type:complete
MAILRSDQSQLTFAAEAAQGGSPEMQTGDRVTSGQFDTTLAAAANAGDISIVVSGDTGDIVISDHIRIGGDDGANSSASTVVEFEVRRIVHSDGTTVFLDQPLGFFHASGEHVEQVDANLTGSNQFFNYITQVPGVYESVSVPDMAPSIEPRYYLGTDAKRQAAEFYAGQQTYSGSLGGMILLNANPLRFPIGKMITIPSSVASDTILLDGAVKKGDIYIDCDGSDVGNLAVNDYIQITDASGGTTNSEVRQIIAEPGTDIFRLDKPLRFDHEDNSQVHEVVGGATPSGHFVHTITPENDLDTLTWHVHMRDSSETAANDFNRRYYGGMVDSATISADEGGLLTFGWDTVNFLGMVHNQAKVSQPDVNAGSEAALTAIFNSDSPTSGMPKFGLMNSITSSDIDFPSNNPYYFSQGSILFMGNEIARLRSFNISISNATEPRYYISGRHGRNRGPSEIREGRKSYNMSCTLALPDTEAAATGIARENATEIFKQLILEGNYGDALGAEGFNISLTFTRGTNDTIQILIPDDYTSGTESGGAEPGINQQGAFITSAPHNLTGDGSALQVDVDMIFRSLKIIVTDSVPSYS